MASGLMVAVFAACATGVPAEKDEATAQRPDELRVPDVLPCGSNECAVGEFCCNASCGICAPLNGSCTMQYCGLPTATTCGDLICPRGMTGCNCACANAACVPEGTACAAVCQARD